MLNNIGIKNKQLNMNKKIVLALIIIILLSGCTTNNGLTAYDAPEAQVDKSTLNNTSYQYERTEKIPYNKTINTSLTDLKVSINSYLTLYERQNEGNLVPKSTYGVLSTPSLSPSGVELNPIIVDTTDNIENYVSNNSENYSLKIQDKINETNVTTDRYNNTTIETYNSSIKIEEADASVDSRLVTSVIKTNKSVLVGFALYPTASNDGSKQQEYAINMIKNTYINENES